MRARPSPSLDSILLYGLLAGLLGTVAAPVARAHAQAPVPDEHGALADAWVEHMLAQQDSSDTLLRYLVAPSATLFGGLMLSAPAWGELNPAADIAYVAGGAAMLTAAIGTWATPDPYDAQRWYGTTASLGFVGLGVGLVASCTDDDSLCAQSGFPRGLSTSIGIIDAGTFLTTFFLWTLAPPPSPGALQLSVRGLSPEQRHTRVLSFLEKRERSRRLWNYASLPWGVALGASVLGFAHDAARPGGRAFLYGCGGVMLGVVAASTLYELLRTTESERFIAGERPDD